MLELDHLVVIAPSLAEGVAHVRERLGIEMPFGGAHPTMGTHNHVLRLGDGAYLEVIAVDPDAPKPAHPRWFGLDDAVAVRAAWDEGRRLRTWVARTGDLDGVLARHGDVLGAKTSASRGDRTWLISIPPDGSLPAEGAMPSIIDWGPRGTPIPALPDFGCRLISFEMEHPEAERATERLRSLGAAAGPAVRPGPRLRYAARIETPMGVRDLF